MYLIQVLKPSKAVLIALERIFNSFLWDKTQEAKRIHWTAWERICFPTDEGGLGVNHWVIWLKPFLASYGSICVNGVLYCWILNEHGIQ